MSRRRPWRHRHHVDALVLRDLLGPDLPAAAACAGLAPMFDLTIAREPVDDRDHRHAAAVATCRTCPVLTECAEAVDAEPRPAGVWAGRVLDPTTTPTRSTRSLA